MNVCVISEYTCTFDDFEEMVEVVEEETELSGSATAFETYAACPYRYFLSRKLRVEPTESPEEQQTLDPLVFGTLIHKILEIFANWPPLAISNWTSSE